MSHILERERVSRASRAWRLSQLGWTQEEIGATLGVTQQQVSNDTNNSQLGKICETLGEHWNDKGIAEVANRLNLSLHGEELPPRARGKVQDRFQFGIYLFVAATRAREGLSRGDAGIPSRLLGVAATRQRATRQPYLQKFWR